MLKKTMIAMLLFMVLVVSTATEAPYVSAGSEAQADDLGGQTAFPLGSYWDCQHSCSDCQNSCQNNVPAGSARTDCLSACTASAAGCCNAYGKKPPSGLTCDCN